MTDTNATGTAATPFPTATTAPWAEAVYERHLRDKFATAALIGILAGGFADTVPHDDVEGGRQAAEFAYQYADAMLSARGRTEAE